MEIDRRSRRYRTQTTRKRNKGRWCNVSIRSEINRAWVKLFVYIKWENNWIWMWVYWFWSYFIPWADFSKQTLWSLSRSDVTQRFHASLPTCICWSHRAKSNKRIHNDTKKQLYVILASLMLRLAPLMLLLFSLVQLPWSAAS